MAPIYSAAIKFSATKNCFLTIPSCWLTSHNSSQDIIIAKITYDDNKEAFMSCKIKPNNAAYFKAQVLIDGRFAEKLGIKEKEEVCIELSDHNVNGATKVFVEPLHHDYWEIMSLNSTYIEENLMNQVRIVWKDLVFPIWVQESVVFAKVAHVIPELHPALLKEFTEIDVSPMENFQSSTVVTPALQKPKETHLQYKHLRRKSKPFTSAELKEIRDEMSVKSNSSSSKFSLIQFVYEAVAGAKDTNTDDSIEELNTEEIEPLQFDATFRVIPFSGNSSHENELPLSIQSTTVFITAASYIKVTGQLEVPPCFVAKLERFPFPTERKPKKDVSNAGDNSKLNSKSDEIGHKLREEKSLFDSVCVNVVVLQSAEEDEYGIPISLFFTNELIVVPKELKKSLGLCVSSVVRCKSVESRPVKVQKLLLHPVVSLHRSCDEEKVLKAFTNWAKDSNLENSSLLISEGTFATLNINEVKKEALFFVSLQDNILKTPSSLKNSPTTPEAAKVLGFENDPIFGYINEGTIDNITVKIGAQMSTAVRSMLPALFKPQDIYQIIPGVPLESLGGIEDIAEKAMIDIEFWLKLRPLSYICNQPSTFNGCLLLCGPKGIGKTTLAYALCKKLCAYPYYVYVSMMECLPLRGKRIETIAKSFDACLMDAVHRQPSLILLEDLDFVASCPATPEQSAGPDGLYFLSIANTFINFMHKVVESKTKIVVLVTSKSTHSLHPSLLNSKGRHIFQTVLEMEPPSAVQRESILRALVSNKLNIQPDTLEAVHWNELALKTDGYFAKDLDSLVDRSIHASWINNALDNPAETTLLSNKEFLDAMEGCVPTSLRGIPLQLTEKKKWSDVGGLHEVKKVIQQIITWPVKYKALFKNYTLKPQSNILLYGAPGTGKTLLASVVANECGLNFISIKGPELLSKYIGASEQAIRDLFQKACSAKPCILFFDEFDSIAPRRGHDSTGVTDRVVNQLLTQLDGVESLEGVHVLAATSRPELIDPALLRPGRLDKCVLCPLPDQKERLEILNCLSSKLPLSENVDFEPLIELTEHFSGADLQALLYSAHIEALHEAQNYKSGRLSSSPEEPHSIDKSKLTFFPSIEEGPRPPTAEEEKRLLQEVDVLISHYQGAKKGVSRGRHRHSTLVFAIEQHHLIKTVSGMKPSVSLKERLRYQAVFANFKSPSDKTADSVAESVKRVTLA